MQVPGQTRFVAATDTAGAARDRLPWLPHGESGGLMPAAFDS